MFCVIPPWSFFPIPFKPQKHKLKCLFHLKDINFNQYLPSVHPVDVTDLRLFYIKIDHNSINLHRIPTKSGTETCFNEPFMCTKFQLDRRMHSQAMAEIVKCAKRQHRRKNEDTILEFYSLVSWDWLERFASNLVCRFT